MNFVRLLVHLLLFFLRGPRVLPLRFHRWGIRSVGLLRALIAALLLRHCHATTAPLLRNCYVGCAFSTLPWLSFGSIFTFSSTRLGAIETRRFRRFLRRPGLLPRIRTSKAGCLRWPCAISTSFLRHFFIIADLPNGVVVR